jgi:predicted PurR-regulated permease PerM
MCRKLKMGRRLAVLLTISIIAVAAGSLTLTIVNQGPKSTERALEELPKVVEDMQDAPLIGGWLTDHDAATTVRDELERLPGRISESRGALELLPSVGSQVADVVWVILLTIAFLLDGGRLMSALTREVPVRHRRQFTRLLGVSHQALAGYAAGAVLVSAMNGVVVLILAISLQIGLAAVLALWAFLWDFIPQVGGIIGGVPLMLFALIRGPGPFLIATVVYMVYQLIESNVIFPAIIGDSVDIPPWATMVAALVGAAAAGVLGAIVLTPLVGVVRSAMVEYRRDDFPGRTTA